MADPRAKPAKVQLDAPGTEAGAMERLFLLEATTPGPRSYVASENLKAMRLMRPGHREPAEVAHRIRRTRCPNRN